MLNRRSAGIMHTGINDPEGEKSGKDARKFCLVCPTPFSKSENNRF